MAARKKTKVSTTSPWFIPNGQVLGLRAELLPVLLALDGRSPREIKAEDPFGDERPQQNDLINTSNSTAVISVIGPITQYEGICDWMFGGTSVEAISAQLDEAMTDDTVDSIVMVVDSPGGEIHGVADLADKIFAANKVKPVVTFVPGECCSAAYWPSSASSKIILSQTALAGSIGAVITYEDRTAANEKAGIRQIEFVSSVSPKKRVNPTTDEGKTEVQSLADQYGNLFVAAVASMRGVSTEKVLNDFGQGGVLIGVKAVEAGLADSVGTLDDAIQAAQQLAGAASDSTTDRGFPRSTTERARAAQGGGPMADKKTGAQLLAEHPEAAAEIVAQAAQAERERVSAILKLNTTANRAVASKQIDEAVANPSMTAGNLALQILDMHAARNKKVAGDRSKDEVEPVEGVTPEQGDQDRVEASKPKIDTQAIYAKLNGGK